MGKASRLQRLEETLAPRAIRRLPTIIQTTVTTHAEYLELKALREAHRGPIKLPKDAGPIVRLTAAKYKRLLIASAPPIARRKGRLSRPPRSR